MFIIWGTKRTTKVLAQTQLYTCPKCNNVQPFSVLRLRKWFHIFWIPLIPYSNQYYLACPICNAGLKIEKQQALEYTQTVLPPQQQQQLHTQQQLPQQQVIEELEQDHQ